MGLPSVMRMPVTSMVEKRSSRPRSIRGGHARGVGFEEEARGVAHERGGGRRFGVEDDVRSGRAR